jgi:hypothetical protein
VALVSRFSRSELAAVTLPACVLTVLWVPLTLGLEQAVELQVPIALGAPIGVLLASTCLALRPSDSRRLLAAAAVVLLGSLGWAVSVPASTLENPSRLALVHSEEVGSEGARLFALSGRAPLPEELAKVASFSTEPKPAFPEFPWLPEGFVAPTSTAPTDGAQIEVLETQREECARILDVRCFSPRGASCFVIHVSGLKDENFDGGVLSATLGGASIEHPVHSWSWTGMPDGTKTVEWEAVAFGVPREGVVWKLRVPLDQPAKLLLLDVEYGLPPGDARFARARPEHCVPIGQGDQWVVARRAEL